MSASATSLITYCLPESKRVIETDYIILHGSGPWWFAANQTALDISRCLLDGQTVDDIADGLAARFRISCETARGDVQQVADRLQELRFLDNTAYCTLPSPALQSLYIHLTKRCNLTCPHCYLDSSKHADLPTSLVLRIIDELRDSGGSSVTLSGGEPFLHPDIKDILRYAASKARVQLLSNGILIDKNWASFLAEEVDPDIQLSLDGSRAEIHDRIRGRGSFARTLRAVELLQEAGLSRQITLAATIMKSNLEDLPEIIRLAQTLGVSQVRFLPLRRVGRADHHWRAIGELKVEEYEQFFDYAAGWRGENGPALAVSCGLSGFMLEIPAACGGGENWCPVGGSLIIDVLGDAYPCVLMMRDEFKLGNVFQQGLTEIMQGERLAWTVRSLIERRVKVASCAACNWRNLCQGGCMGQALEETGTIWAHDPFCSYRKRAYQSAFDRILQDFGQNRFG